MKDKKKEKQKINWVNTLFLIITPIVAVIGGAWLIIEGNVHTATLILGLCWLMASGLAITAGYHRLWAHTTYQANPIIKVFFLLFGAAAFEGSALEWCTDHRNHHRYVDTERDPYNINRGFWYAHIGWLMILDQSKRNFDNVEDMSTDYFIKFQHKYYSYIAIFMGFIVPTLIAALWHDWLGGLIWVGVMRMVLNHHFTFCINSVCHLFGKQRYSADQTARDNWVTALFTYGEGFHNFHHQFPLDYRNGIRFYHYDPAKWLIRFLSWIGLTKDLKKIGVGSLLKYRLRADEQYLLSMFKSQSETLRAYINEHLTPVKERILQVIAKIESIEKEKTIKEYRRHLRKARQELKFALMTWSRLIKPKTIKQ